MNLLRSFIVLLLLIPSLAFSLELSPLAQVPYTGDLDSLKKKGTVRVLVSADLGHHNV
jgi:hypothetical protein